MAMQPQSLRILDLLRSSMRALSISRAQILRCELKNQRKSRNFAKNLTRFSRNFARISRRARANLDHETRGRLWRELHGRIGCLAAKILIDRAASKSRKSCAKNTADFYKRSRFSASSRFVLHHSDARNRKPARGTLRGVGADRRSRQNRRRRRKRSAQICFLRKFFSKRRATFQIFVIFPAHRTKNSTGARIKDAGNSRKNCANIVRFFQRTLNKILMRCDAKVNKFCKNIFR